MEYLTQLMAFLAAHPELWPFVLTFLALAFKALDKYPRFKAVHDALKAAGFDETRLVDALKRIVTGKFPPALPPAAPPAPPSDSDKSK